MTGFFGGVDDDRSYSAGRMNSKHGYVGRLAPSPTGLLHLGHANTFRVAQLRAEAAGGTLMLRNEDLDPQRSKDEFVEAMVEDLAWLGIDWEPPMVSQSELWGFIGRRLRGCWRRGLFIRAVAAGRIWLA